MIILYISVHMDVVPPKWLPNLLSHLQVVNGFMMAFRPVGSFLHDFVSFTREVQTLTHTHKQYITWHADVCTQSIWNDSWPAAFLQRDVSEIRSITLTQFLLNWTLAELADVYRPKNTSVVPERPKFDVTNVEDWYQQVVMPLLRRFLPNDEALMHQNVTLAFHQVLYVAFWLIFSIHSFVLYIIFHFVSINIELSGKQ